MSMSTFIFGFREPDEKWQKMKTVYDACLEANIAPPEEVVKFFGHEPPNSAGIKVEIASAVSKITMDASEIWEVDLAKVPSHITKIQFENSF